MSRVLKRAIRNALLAVLLAGTAAAVVPPRPGGHERPPVALDRWTGLRPGAPANLTQLVRGDKQTSVTLRALVVPAGFADLAGKQAVTKLQTVFSGPGSVRDYWTETSDGLLTVTAEVTAWQRAPQIRSYYQGSDNGMDVWSAPHNAGRFVLDAVTAADAAGLDWGRYDDDGPDGVPNSGDDDGVVDALLVLHAGGGGECGTSALWSHQFFLAGWGYGRFTTSTPRPGGGFVQVDDYVLVPELSCDGGLIEIGVICHEMGHLFGLPDLYDTQGGRAGIGGWGLMGTGSWGGDGQHPESPSHLSAWSRLELGWAQVEEAVIDGPASITDQVLTVRDPDQPAGERWLVEHRKQVGFDASLPAAGFLIWHVDDEVIADTQHLNRVNAGAILGVALEPGDGRDDLTTVGGNRGDSGDPWPGATGAARFDAARDNDGVLTDVEISEILPPSLQVAIGVDHADTTPPVVSLLAPIGGEAWTLGDMHTLRWSADDDEALGTVELWLSLDGGATFPKRLAHDLTGVTSWQGTLARDPGTSLRVQVIAHDAAGNQGLATSGDFALVDRYPPAIDFDCPINAGTTITPGEVVSLTWNSADNVAVVAVDVELSCDGGDSWQPTSLGDQPPSAASVIWSAPDVYCGQAQLRAVARDAAGNEGSYTSQPFTIAGATTGVPDVARLGLGPCVPNPFNPRAEIYVAMPAAGRLRIAVHDLRGRQVRVLRDGWQAAGSHRIAWDGRDTSGRDVASGVYYVRAASAAGPALLKVTLVR